MKKLLLAVVLYATTVGLASAAGVSATDSAYRGDPGPVGQPLFVRGIDGDWGETNAMSYDAGTQTYNALISISGLNHEFKIATSDWDSAAWGHTNYDLTGTDSVTALMLEARFGQANASLDLGVSGLYLFSLDVSNWAGPEGDYDLTVSRQVVPIPAAGLLLLSAIGGLGLFRRK